MRKGKPNIKGLLMLEMLNSTHFLSRKGVVRGGVREGGGRWASKGAGRDQGRI